MIIILFFIFHWYFSLFFQSFFNHRYSAHQMFTMSRGWEKFFFVMNWIANGSSYLSPKAYGILHRMHHAGADTEKDPHSPKFSKNIFDMMWKTRDAYLDVFYEKKPIEPRFKENIPAWDKFDNFAEHIYTRLVWVAVYAVFFALVATAWWQWLFFPLVTIMGPLHGAIINWFAHKIGYTNFKVSDTSKNFLPVDVLMWGESYHNNHHVRAKSANFGYKWWEIDPMWPLIKLLDWVGVIRLVKKKEEEGIGELIFSRSETHRIRQAFAGLNLPVELPKRASVKPFLDSWDSFVKKDWKKDLGEYMERLQARRAIQVIIENANESVRNKLLKVVEPIDRRFKERAHPWDENLLNTGKVNLSGKNFWETHSIFQG